MTRPSGRYYSEALGQYERACARCGKGLSQGHDVLAVSVLVDRARLAGIPLALPDSSFLSVRCAARLQEAISGAARKAAELRMGLPGPLAGRRRTSGPRGRP